jgi:hypothetical protein
MTAARALRAQQKAMPVGRLSPCCLARPVSPYMDAFRRGLSEPGYVEGQNLAIEYRWGEAHSDRLPDLAPMTRVQAHPAENAGLVISLVHFAGNFDCNDLIVVLALCQDARN